MPGIFDNLVSFGDTTEVKEERKEEVAQTAEASQTNEEGPQGESKDIRKDFYSQSFYDYYKR